MSDLISRSELIKHFEAIQSQECAIGLDFVAMIDVIKEQPTYYDIDKVVEELEQLKNKGSVTKTEKLITNACVNKAIEIVKHGGVSEDVCEWKYNDTEYYWESSCDHLHIFMSDGPKENEYDFCPYCGKKIKIVGD